MHRPSGSHRRRFHGEAHHAARDLASSARAPFGISDRRKAKCVAGSRRRSPCPRVARPADRLGSRERFACRGDQARRTGTNFRGPNPESAHSPELLRPRGAAPPRPCQRRKCHQHNGCAEPGDTATARGCGRSIFVPARSPAAPSRRHPHRRIEPCLPDDCCRHQSFACQLAQTGCRQRCRTRGNGVAAYGFGQRGPPARRSTRFPSGVLGRHRRKPLFRLSCSGRRDRRNRGLGVDDVRSLHHGQAGLRRPAHRGLVQVSRISRSAD